MNLLAMSQSESIEILITLMEMIGALFLCLLLFLIILVRKRVLEQENRYAPANSTPVDNTPKWIKDIQGEEALMGGSPTGKDSLPDDDDEFGELYADIESEEEYPEAEEEYPDVEPEEEVEIEYLEAEIEPVVEYPQAEAEIPWEEDFEEEFEEAEFDEPVEEIEPVYYDIEVEQGIHSLDDPTARGALEGLDEFEELVEREQQEANESNVEFEVAMDVGEASGVMPEELAIASDETASEDTVVVIPEPESEPAAKVSADEEDDDDDDDEEDKPEIRVVEQDGVEYYEITKFRRSFTAKLIQGTEEVKRDYSELKNEFMSYQGVKSRISWRWERIRVGKNTVAKIRFGKNLVSLCFALNPQDYERSKYKFTDLSDQNSYADTPCVYRIENARRIQYAKELIARIMEREGASKKRRFKETDYAAAYPYETREALVEKKLIKTTKQLKDIQ